uniref:Uncharacterized protein n=1 Tax=Manihot esculenta TaxID=3983 RepID=A0A2C9VZ55_MANES
MSKTSREMKKGETLKISIKWVDWGRVTTCSALTCRIPSKKKQTLAHNLQWDPCMKEEKPQAPVEPFNVIWTALNAITKA